MTSAEKGKGSTDQSTTPVSGHEPCSSERNSQQTPLREKLPGQPPARFAEILLKCISDDSFKTFISWLFFQNFPNPQPKP